MRLSGMPSYSMGMKWSELIMDIYDEVQNLLVNGKGNPRTILDRLRAFEKSSIYALSELEQMAPECNEKVRCLMEKAMGSSTFLTKNTRDIIRLVEDKVFLCNTSRCPSCRDGICHDTAVRKNGFHECVNHS